MTTCLDYRHARHYSPHLGRFFSPDPLGESASARVPQSWNRYSYAQGNPLKYVDPTGEVISLGSLSASDIIKLLEDLNELTGNTYGIDDDKNLIVLEVGKGSSGTATEFLNELIGSETTFSVVATQGKNRALMETNTIELNLGSFEGAKYGRVDPRAFNLGTSLVHELHHLATGSRDINAEGKVSYSYDWTGPAVDFVNEIRAERGLPLRAAYVGKPTVFGHREKVFFDHVHPKRPDRIYYVVRRRFD